jgi:predicted dehydrogenase
MRNWYYFNWLCGDHINEQHIHNLDVINWLKNGAPVEANGMGGREVRRGKDHGQIFDHHFVEFTYADNSKMFSQCRHIPNTWSNVSEHAHGTKGHADISGGRLYGPDGKPIWSTNAERDGHQVEHHHLFADLREGKIPAEGEYGAMSTMTAILGRMATYSGKVIKMKDALASNLALADFASLKNLNSEAPLKPDENGNYPVPVPGQEKVL